MGRLIGVDFGKKRVGLAVTDPLQIIASALDTVPTEEIFIYLIEYCKKEHVDGFVVGVAKDLQGKPTDSTVAINKFISKLKKVFSKHPINLQDERFTSKMALDAMVRAGSTKKQRRKKENIDKISATIILQSFMDSKQNNQ